MPRLRVACAWLVVAAASVACVPGQLGAGDDDAGPGADAGAGDTSDGGVLDDGAPDHRACTSSFGDEVSQGYGRLDGFLRAVVPTGHGPCRADDDHVHLQIESGGAVTDVAVNLDVLSLAVEHAPVDAWSEGWHTDARLDYVGDLGEHAAAFVSHAASENEAAVESALADANHVSIYAKGYGSDGIHDVHRNGARKDGAIVVRPTEASALYLVFRFSDQQF